MPIRIQQGSAAHWVLRVVGVAIVAYLALSPTWRDLKPVDYGNLTDICVLALAALSLNLLIGFTGQISIGHSAFFGIGAYTLAILVADHGWSPGWTYPVAAVICFVVGVIVGIPALRLKGLYLALVTLALAEIFPALVSKFDSLTGGSQGIGGLNYNAPSWTGLEAGRRGRAEWMYWVALGTLALGYVIVRNLVKSRAGRAMIAVRDNTTAAAVMGVNVAFTKTIAFGVSAALAGLAGCTFALRQTQATPENQNFTILGSIIFLVIMVIGGAASLAGPIVGAVVYWRIDDFSRNINQRTYLPDFVQDIAGRPNFATLLFSVLLVLLMFVAPFGIVGTAKYLARRILVVLPNAPSGVPPPETALPPTTGGDTDDDLGSRPAADVAPT